MTPQRSEFQRQVALAKVRDQANTIPYPTQDSFTRRISYMSQEAFITALQGPLGPSSRRPLRTTSQPAPRAKPTRPRWPQNVWLLANRSFTYVDSLGRKQEVIAGRTWCMPGAEDVQRFPDAFAPAKRPIGTTGIAAR